MTSGCRRCGGFVIYEREADYYRMSRRRCVSCGWYRNDVNVSSGQGRRSANRGVYKLGRNIEERGILL